MSSHERDGRKRACGGIFDAVTRSRRGAKLPTDLAAELNVRELVRTNNLVLISAIEALLKGADIAHMIVDQNMSVMEGSIGIFPRRILVDEEELTAARRLLSEAGLADELRPDGR
jgi:Putative prokaryotic signal transducing protein